MGDEKRIENNNNNNEKLEQILTAKEEEHQIKEELLIPAEKTDKIEGNIPSQSTGEIAQERS